MRIERDNPFFMDHKKQELKEHFHIEQLFDLDCKISEVMHDKHQGSTTGSAICTATCSCWVCV
ncbi:MAG: hypothetical protein ACRDDW_06545 [Candidatus Rhabdochlamydia sp.]